MPNYTELVKVCLEVGKGKKDYLHAMVVFFSFLSPFFLSKMIEKNTLHKPQPFPLSCCSSPFDV